MRRDKAWWGRLTKEERAHLVYLERNHEHTGYGGGGYLPDDCSECAACGTPIFGSGSWCNNCYEDWKSYIKKAEGN